MSLVLLPVLAYNWATVISIQIMSDISFELRDQLLPILRAGDVAQCERITAARLAAMPRSPFHIILDLAITTHVEGFAAVFDKFFQREGARFKIAAAYTEMNAFDINTK